MSKPSARGVTADRETLEVLNPFLEVLRSTQPIAIPLDTLQGALGHFLSSLEGEQLESFVHDVVSSESLWKAMDAAKVESAVRVTAAGKVNSLRLTAKDTLFKRNQLDKAAQKWLRDLLEFIKKEKSDNSLYLCSGLLQGLDDVKGVNWGKPRIALEEEIILAIADRIEKHDASAMESYSAAAPHIALARLRALDLKSIVPKLHDATFEALGFPPAPTNDAAPVDVEKAMVLSRGLASSIMALAEGSLSSMRYAWEVTVNFTSRMLDSARELRREWDSLHKPAVGSQEWMRLKAALSTFIAVAWPTTELILHPGGNPSRKQRVGLAAHTVATLSKFSPLTEEPDGVVEGYDKALFGCLDLIAAEGGTEAVQHLFEQLDSRNMDDSLAAFILVTAEQLIHHIDAETVRETVFPLAEKYVFRPQHRSSFEAAHAFLLALLETASKSLKDDPSQGPFVDALVSICARTLLSEAREGGVKPEQLTAAYPAVVHCAARRSIDLVHHCVDQLNGTKLTSKEYVKAVKTIRISIAPCIPRPEVNAYLDDIAYMITSVPKDSEERLELCKTIFSVIMNDMPDDSKQIAIEWWLRWRRRLEAGQETPQARL